MVGRRVSISWLLRLWLFLPWVWALGLQSPTVGFSSTRTTTTQFVHHFDESVPRFTGISTCSAVIRYGEADHPGPTLDTDDLAMPSLSSTTLRIGCSNPGGLKGKEHAALSLGCGIWCFAETHLTLASQRSVAFTVTQQATTLNRQVRTHFGSPVPYRANSLEAGTWSGVGVLSDFPSREIHETDKLLK